MILDNNFKINPNEICPINKENNENNNEKGEYSNKFINKYKNDNLKSKK